MALVLTQGEYRLGRLHRRVRELIEAAERETDADRRRHLIDLAETDRRVAAAMESEAASVVAKVLVASGK
jgi:hypothetical protein